MDAPGASLALTGMFAPSQQRPWATLLWRADARDSLVHPSLHCLLQEPEGWWLPARGRSGQVLSLCWPCWTQLQHKYLLHSFVELRLLQLAQGPAQIPDVAAAWQGCATRGRHCSSADLLALARGVGERGCEIQADLDGMDAFDRERGRRGGRHLALSCTFPLFQHTCPPASSTVRVGPGVESELDQLLLASSLHPPGLQPTASG